MDEEFCEQCKRTKATIKMNTFQMRLFAGVIVLSLFVVCDAQLWGSNGFGTPQMQGVDRYRGLDIPQGSASLAFVFDVTGSMYDDLVQVIEGAAKILATTISRREKPLYNYILVPFHDPKVWPAVVTTDPDKYQEELRDLFVQGGGDCPEMSIGAIKSALEEALPNSFIYVFTDARAKDYDLTEQVLTLIQQKQSQVVFVMTGDCGNTTHPGYKAYEQIASTSSGQIFLLKKSQVNRVLNFVRVAVQVRKVNLFSIDRKQSGKLKLKLPVDAKLQEFTVSLSGKNPGIRVLDNDGKEYTDEQGLKSLLNIQNARIINAKNLVPGIWTLELSATGQHTIRVTGLSSLNFIHGFSKTATLNITETKNRPIKGIPNFLLINVTDLDYPGRVNQVELISFSGETILTLPVVYNSKRPHLYNISSFQPPDDFFYIRVVGIDGKGFEFHRTSHAAISPIEPDVPIVVTDFTTKGYYDKTALLTCNVYSIVPFNVQWYRGKEKLGNQLFYSESSNVTWSIPDASSSSEGYYSCNVTNAAGSAAAVTYLDVKDPPPSIQKPNNASGLPGSDVVMTCIAYSTVPFNITWFRKNGTDLFPLTEERRARIHENGSVTLRRVNKNDEGNFVCRAQNEGGYNDEELWLLVEKKPIVTPIPPVQHFVDGGTVDILCSSVSFPPPKYIWRRNGAILPITSRISYDENTGLITLQELTQEDAGEYECMATNTAGTGFGVATLNYFKAPKIKVPEKTVLVNNGETATLSCKAQGIPQPKLTWFKGGLELAEVSFIQISDDGDLVILGTQEMDGGVYRCVAENEAGTDEAKVELKVGSAPFITEGPSSIGVEILHNASLRCAATGVPEPRIQWKRADGKAMDFQNRFGVTQDGTLLISEIQKEDEGMYTCQVSNQFGKQEQSAYVTVTGIMRPLIAYKDPRVVTNERRTVRLLCVVLLGNPSPTIYWLHLGEKVTNTDKISDDGQGNLVIEDITRDQEGEYTCVASNVGGNATFVMTVDVQVAPTIADSDEHQDLSVTLGRSITLPCQVSAEPEPTIVWTKNGVRVTDSDPHYFKMEDGSLKIFSADPQDTATYSCTASNVAGVAEKRMTLFVQIPPRIEQDENEVIVIISNPVHMTCTAQGIPDPEIEWFKEDKPVEEDSNILFVGGGALRINSVKLDDAGMYECVASSIAGNDTKLVHLMVQVPPSILGEEVSDIVVKTGEEVTLPCETEGDPRPMVRWRKDLTEIDFFDTNHKYLKEEKGSLFLPQAEVSDSARYLCVAENPAGVVTKEILLTVHDPPSIPANTPNGTSVIEGNRVILPCPAKGTPSPRISWHFDGKEMTGNEIGVRLMPDGSLQLEHAQAEQAGLYTCTASNVAGKSTHKVTLQVFMPPRFREKGKDGDNPLDNDFIPRPENAEVIENGTIVLTCHAEAIPPPTITWYKDKIEIRRGALGPRVKIRNDGRELVIKGAQVEDASKYSCIASNVAGETEKKITLSVQVPPTIEDQDKTKINITVLVDRNAIIECPASGVPPPKITWYKDGQPLNTEYDPSVRVKGGGKRLEIISAYIDDTGNYKCIAENDAGKVEKKYRLDVLIPAKIDGEEAIAKPEVIENKTVTLHCPATGIPIPKVTWFKEGEEITANTSRVYIVDNGWKLQIENANPDDSVRYKCKAKNKAGDSTKYYDLHVLVPPTIERVDVDFNPKVKQNGTIYINCPATGTPQPEIVWMKGNTPIDHFTQGNIELIANGRQLKLKNAQISDTGLYRCMAVSKAGEDQVDFNLEVQIPVFIDKTGIILNPKVVINRTQVLDCPVVGIPIPRVRWTKDGSSIDLQESPNIVISRDGRTLEVQKAQVPDAGLYECRAENEAGMDHLNFDLQVLVPPYIDHLSSTEGSPQVIVNRTIELNCVAYGIPNPNIRWLMNGRPIKKGDSERYRFQSDNKVLVIKDAQVPDDALYTCIATNEAGNAEKDFKLEVLVPPYIDTDGLDLNPNVVKMKMIFLNCPAMGIPYPEVTWYKNGALLEMSDRVRFLLQGRQVEITEAGEKDVGTYTCEATNIAGKTNLDFLLKILVPPSIDDANIVQNPKVKEGRTVILECPVSGIPPPKVKWFFNGENLKLKNHMRLLADGRQIQITRSQTSDTGRYTCTASNVAGEMKQNFDLEILVRASIKNSDELVKLEVVENGTVYLDCPAEGIPPPSIMWLRDGEPLLDFPYRNLRQIGNGKKLEIRNVQLSDEGRYTCQATNVAGQERKSFRVKVQVPPRIPGSREPTDVTVIVRQAMRLECSPTGDPEPKVIWFRNGEPLDENDRHIRVIRAGRILQIVGAEIDDTGEYTCEAENIAGKDRKQFNLEVHVPPTIKDSLHMDEHNVVIGQSAVFDCQVEGSPEPKITWLRENKPFSPLFNPSLRLVSGGRQLQVFNAQLIDIGGYTCSASNVAGNASKEFSLNVLVPPAIEEGPTEVAATENTRAMLRCESYGLPDPDITWEKDGRQIPNNGLRYRMHKPGSLEFSAVNTKDTGSYKCIATNEAGSVHREIKLTVQVMPTLKDETSTSVETVVGETVLLPCEPTGFPKPMVTWRKGARKLGNSKGYEMIESGSLRINSAELRDAGIYICVGQNAAGMVLKQVRLTVLVPPTIEEQATEFNIVQDRALRLPCRVDGLPAPKISWMKDGKKIQNDNYAYRMLGTGWLSILRASPEDSGTYTCIAENQAGREEISMNVIVQVPPTIESSERVVTVIEGREARLVCKSTGSPAPTVSWIHDGREQITNGGGRRIHEDGTLVIKRVDADDSGSYVCTAVNIAGKASKEITLNVQVPPKIIKGPEDHEVMAGARIELECVAEGIPIPIIRWLVNNTDFPSPRSVNGRSRLMIDNAMKRDDGTYMCIAKNEAGERRALAGVRVKVPPRSMNWFEKQAVTLSAGVTLDCPVEGGDPPPRIIWKRNGLDVDIDGRIQMMMNGSLVIYDSTNEDAGEWECTATNDAGSTSGVAILTVRSQPTITITPPDMTVDSGDTVIMDCKAEGGPEPEITWKRHSQPIITDGYKTAILPNNSLRIISAQYEDSGMYICTASNPLGREAVQAELTVRVHGHWSFWAHWSDCSVSCGNGERMRQRKCDNPRPANGGRECKGSDKDVRNCLVRECPIQGNWGSWSVWEPCSKTCDSGKKTRTRLCNNPSPQFGGENCIGNPVESIPCNSKPCPVNGDWGAWGGWQKCSESCGEGVQERYRKCDNPPVQYGGRQCIGEETDRRPCIVDDCAVNGNWGDWAPWSTCTRSCDGGQRERNRVCNDPPPSNGGRQCSGRDHQIDYCNKEACAVHGNWADWSQWGDCTLTCGGGQMRRFRTCTNPAPQNNGRPCIGQSQDTEKCNEEECSVDGQWTQWGDWTPCSRSCDGGTQERYRRCKQPQFGGSACPGDKSQMKKCSPTPCKAGLPRTAIGNIIGNVNNQEFGVATLTANISRTGGGTKVQGIIVDLPKDLGVQMQHLVSLLSPIYWTTATEVGEAVNGFTLTEGNFRREVQVEFATGEILKMTHVARGLDAEGVLRIDIIMNGYIPELPPTSHIVLLPYMEDYIQTGPGSLYAYSSRMFKIDGYSLPYAWNHSITYNEAYGKMPFLVERLTTEDLFVDFDVTKEVLQYKITASIAKGEPSNQCPSGFFLDPEGPYCKDDDECSNRKPCSHLCINTPGSFTCACPPGLTLAAHGRVCKDIDECEVSLSTCHPNQECINTVGSYKCLEKCDPGFKRKVGHLECKDINECRKKPRVCDQQCKNTIGSYECSCNRGFRLVNGKCRDIDECAEQTHMCSHDCINTLGSYRCECPRGFRVIGHGICRDVNECAEDIHDCISPHQECRNSHGGYMCVDACEDGFVKAPNGTCVDKDECKLGLHKCIGNQACVNTRGGYHCSCPRGFRSSGQGKPCVDIDECATHNPCQHSCQNTEGTYRCTCPPGYRLSRNGRNCDDIDECKEQRIQCGENQVCFNTRGDYACLDTICPPDYDRDPRTGYCLLKCSNADIECPPGSIYADVLEFRMVALAQGKPAYVELIRLLAKNQDDEHLPDTTFEIVKNDPIVTFGIRLEKGKGIVYALRPLEEKRQHKITVRAKSYDRHKKGIQYQTTFIIFISVSEFPY